MKRVDKPNSVSRKIGRRSFIWAVHYCPAQAAYPETPPKLLSTLERAARISFPYLALHREEFAWPKAVTSLRR